MLAQLLPYDNKTFDRCSLWSADLIPWISLANNGFILTNIVRHAVSLPSTSFTYDAAIPVKWCVPSVQPSKTRANLEGSSFCNISFILLSHGERMWLQSDWPDVDFNREMARVGAQSTNDTGRFFMTMNSIHLLIAYTYKECWHGGGQSCCFLMIQKQSFMVGSNTGLYVTDFRPCFQSFFCTNAYYFLPLWRSIHISPYCLVKIVYNSHQLCTRMHDTI